MNDTFDIGGVTVMLSLNGSMGEIRFISNPPGHQFHSGGRG
jgi:hypothetical protein